MTNAKDFPFDFNEDADPVDELHRLRLASGRHFKTMKERLEYFRATPSIQEILAELDAEIAERKAKEAAKAARPRKSVAAPSRKSPASYRRSAKAHA